MPYAVRQFLDRSVLDPLGRLTVPWKIKGEGQVAFGDASLVKQPRFCVSAEAMQEDDCRAGIAHGDAPHPPSRWQVQGQRRVSRCADPGACNGCTWSREDRDEVIDRRL